MSKYIVSLAWMKPGANSGVGTQIILEAASAEDAEAEAKTLSPMAAMYDQFQWFPGETVALEEEITSGIYTDGE